MAVSAGMVSQRSNELGAPIASSQESDPPIVYEIVSQHAEEASFLWLLRLFAVSRPNYSLGDLIKLDNRIEAHLHGLHIAGQAGWSLILETLKFDEPCDFFPAGFLAFETGRQDRIDFLSGKLAEKPELAAGVISALGWMRYERAKAHLESLVSSHQPAFRAIGIGAFAIHRVDPGRILNEAIGDEHPAVRARALRAVGELGRIDLLPRMRVAHTDPDDDARFAAAWSGTLLSPNLDSLSVLRTFAESPGPFSGKAMQTTVRRMDLSGAKAWQASLSRRRNRMRAATVAAGAIGDPELISWLIGQMDSPILARIAGEAFTMITGVDFAGEHLDRSPPQGVEFGPTDDPADENVDMDPDEHLPWPDPTATHKWWAKNQKQFQKGVRYLLGKPMSPVWLREVLHVGRQRQRAAAALELAIRQPGRSLFEVRAPGFRQRASLR
jgi:uncharacterized protein (TIGR02270 family)